MASALAMRRMLWRENADLLIREEARIADEAALSFDEMLWAALILDWDAED